MFTKPYGALIEENYDVKIMEELQIQPLSDSDEESHCTLKLVKPKSKVNNN